MDHICEVYSCLSWINSSCICVTERDTEKRESNAVLENKVVPGHIWSYFFFLCWMLNVFNVVMLNRVMQNDHNYSWFVSRTNECMIPINKIKNVA